MASKPAYPPLAERADIHKACKSLETLLNVLNDYCEAAGATAILQRKLAKALRETAGMKTTGEIPANAMNASAIVFELSADIDSKFAKIADKEYDTIGSEVKKWFKKLSKEEKVHDERMANANARIKQAGQVYEKKSKKNPRDAAEEHARYINLIAALGPEISQEKYTAACLARIADAEWLRTCEGVRRFSQTIGHLGEWRALCEGGWMGPVPHDLPDLDESQQPHPDREFVPERRYEEVNLHAPTALLNNDPRGSRESTELQSRPPPGYSSEAEVETARESQRTIPSTPLTGTNQQPSHGTQQNTFVAPSAYDPPRPFSDSNNSDSVRSFSAFPLPPTHFPLPPPRPQLSQSSQPSSYSNAPRLTESPLPESIDGEDTQQGSATTSSAPQAISSSSSTAPPSPAVTTLSPQLQFISTPSSNAPPPSEQHFQDKPTVSEDSSILGPHPEGNKIRQPIPLRSQTMPPPTEMHAHDIEAKNESISSSRAKDDNFDDREFGDNTGPIPKTRASDTPRMTDPIERTDTGGTSGSIVAAMRNRYSSSSGAVSPTPKDIPRLPLSVNDLASRYQPQDTPSSPPLRTPSLSTRQLPSPPIDTGNQNRQGNSYQDRHSSERNMPGSSPTPNSPLQDDAVRRRQQRLNDLAQLELKERELQLLEREREIEKRSRELERDRSRMNDVREDGYENVGTSSRSPVVPQLHTQLKPRERKPSFRNQRPQSQLDPGHSPTATSSQGQNFTRPYSQYSYSTSHLAPPSPSSNSIQPSHSQDGQQSQSSSHYSRYSHSPTPSQQQPPSPLSAHAPYCGCERCSAAKYRTHATPSPVDLRPPATPIQLRPTEKSKPGWMRRLSMPVGGAFGLDSKKGIGNQPGVGGGQGKGRIFSMDGRKNLSSTALRAQEDGRRSFDADGLGNGRR
ncbi:hypothetical protein H0H81_005625 [Sphagnurus paluster]|uniref:Uncharacterized protein n=1 Tax=Sphagnurus paluster TaxID=117069 RepID=A0A9P7K6V2_9AGAR|nr:hypothetical protein H0H81_005625 [Sphagnurus paluster]